MDEAELEKYIRAKSNGRNIVSIRIIESLLGREFASRYSLWKDTFVYVRKNYRDLPPSFPDPTLRRNERRLHEKFDQALSSLKRDGIVIEHIFQGEMFADVLPNRKKGGDELMLAWDSPPTDYDVDHPLSVLCWNELDVKPKDSEKPDDVLLENMPTKAGRGLKDPETGEIYDQLEAYKFWVDQKLHVFDKEMSDEILGRKRGDLYSKPSLTKSVEKTFQDMQGGKATDEMIAHDTVRRTEASLRKFVEDVLRHHGNWWREKCPKDIREKVTDLQIKKKNKRARSDVSLEPIPRLLNDTDLGQLISIIRANKKEFDVAFRDKNLERINPFLTLLKERRDTIDHIDATIPIDEEFLTTLDFLCTYIIKQTEIYYQDSPSD